ncbi:hypothetical protein [Salinispora tropica]|uniref:Uncharacterized protein n=1 Tax=Salinispora tropica (strain ATCC BAA-916 / DSM 44818 / JCM 13857 / NBRC 105044 / CNB-440) TaxID=369723 RepID=A4X9W9_SALTO|nr:hypothetical protein [Salinispora tropica]ABP55709.1 hypothetical protein Strop_3275 [Salinispora tropica CNB-440]
MGATDPGSAREEAERLVATLLAAARLSATGVEDGSPWGPLGGIVSTVLGQAGSSTGAGLSTGTPECCVCPVCRAIVALRDPSPEFAERLATGAGDLAAGVASLLRAFASAQPAPTPAEDRTPETPAPGSPTPVWRAATRSRHDSPSAPEGDAWSAATRVEEAPVPAAAPPVNVAGSAVTENVPATADRPVVPAARVPGDTGEDACGA